MHCINFNSGWCFWQEGKEEQVKAVTLPHDAMIGRKRMPKLKNGAYTGYFPSGDYWYEKHFFAGEEFRNKSVILEFRPCSDRKLYRGPFYNILRTHAGGCSKHWGTWEDSCSVFSRRNRTCSRFY